MTAALRAVVEAAQGVDSGPGRIPAGASKEELGA